jgi:hypothetical protein
MGLDILLGENKGIAEAYIKGEKKIWANLQRWKAMLKERFQCTPSLPTQGLVPLGALDAYQTNQQKNNITGRQYIFEPIPEKFRL